MEKNGQGPVVFCAGLATWDLVFQVPCHPGPDEKIFASAYLGCGGGPAANAAVTAARLGGRAALAACLGNDAFGDQHYRELAEAEVDTRWIVRGNFSTRLAAVLVKPGGERTIISWKGGAPPLPAGAAEEKAPLPGSGVLLLDGHEPELSCRLAERARQQGLPVVLDAGSVHPGTRRLLPLTDYLVASRRFALDFSRMSNPVEALAFLGRLVPVVVVTLGADGVIWQHAGREGAMPAYPVNAVDTTGAGDIYHGAFALALAEKKPFEDILRFAAAAAALGCLKAGARPGCPTRAEVETLLGQGGTTAPPGTGSG